MTKVINSNVAPASHATGIATSTDAAEGALAEAGAIAARNSEGAWALG
jgi:hypothetical protein